VVVVVVVVVVDLDDNNHDVQFALATLFMFEHHLRALQRCTPTCNSSTAILGLVSAAS
jgi:hypothetical protein